MIEVRLATVSDARELSRLNEEFNEVCIPEEIIIQRLKVNDELVVLAQLEEQIVGFACAQCFSSFCYETLQGEITEMYVRPPFRGNGIAASMIIFLEQILYERGVKSVKIITGNNNREALKAYTKQEYILKEHTVLQKKLI